jgi:Na+/H+ antiporter NhaD/arsenite permease-like protein
MLFQAVDIKLVAGLIFALTYTVILLQRVPFLKLDRPSAVGLGATLMIVFGVLDLDRAFKAVDDATLVFLGGMMILVAYLELSGFFELSAAAIVRWSKSPLHLLFYTILASGFFSALFVNDTICLLFTPILLSATRSVKLNPMPFLIGIATASNIGSVMSVVGNPQNMFIGAHSQLPFHVFLQYLAPVSIVGLMVNFALIAFLYRNDLKSWPQHPVPIQPDVRPILMGKTLAVFGLVLVLFVGGHAWNIKYALSAMIGSAVLFLIGGVRPRLVFKKVSWTLLVFFFGLFVVMAGFEASGLNQDIFDSSRSILNLNSLGGYFGVGSVVLLLSNLVSNVPAVVLFEPHVHEIGDPQKTWLVLAMASTLAGNLTLIGSVANLIVADVASENNVRLGFWEYLKVGLPLTIVTLILGTLWLWWI